MPVKRSEKNIERPAPYGSRRPAMTTAVMSALPPQWQVDRHSPTQHWEVNQYGNPVSAADYAQNILAPALNVVHPPQSAQAPVPRKLSPELPPDGAWTAEMDNILIEAQARGMRWETISQTYFPTKSGNACRKRYGRAKEERRANDWDEHRIGRVVAAYNKVGMRERLWGHLAVETGERWQDIEKLVFGQGLPRMIRGYSRHVRAKSRASPVISNDHYSSQDEYEGESDSSIGLGVINGPSVAMRQQPVVTTGSAGEVMRPAHQPMYQHPYVYVTQ